MKLINFSKAIKNKKEFQREMYQGFKEFSCFQLTNLNKELVDPNLFKYVDQIFENQEFRRKNESGINNPRGFYL